MLNRLHRHIARTCIDGTPPDCMNDRSGCGIVPIWETIRANAKTLGCICAALCCLCFAVESQAGPVSSSISIPSLNGTLCHPLALNGQAAVVLFFITNDCPISNAYAPEMERICAKYSPRGVRFYAVYVDASLSAADALKHKREYGLSCVGLRDANHLLVKEIKATVTPECAVVLPNGSLAYRGRIDNRYIDFGKSRYNATTHELRDALESVIHHKPVLAPRTRAVGCYITPPL